MDLLPATTRSAVAAHVALARLDTRVEGMPAQRDWIFQAFRREMWASASLDGVVIDVREAQFADAQAEGDDQAVRRFLRYTRAGMAMAKAARAGKSLSPHVLGRISMIMSGLETGRRPPPWRTQYQQFTGTGIEGADFTVAPPGAELRVGMEQWSSWMRAQNELLVIVKIARALVQLLLLSPFPGSDHLARLMINHELMVSGVLSDPVLPISELLHREQVEFASLLMGVVWRNDFDSLVTFLAEGIQEICSEESARIVEARDSGKALVERYSKRTSITILAEALAFRPVMTLKQVADVCGVSSSRAAMLAQQMQKDGSVDFLDPDTDISRDDDTAYRRVIFVPQTLRNFLDIHRSP